MYRTEVRRQHGFGDSHKPCQAVGMCDVRCAMCDVNVRCLMSDVLNTVWTVGLVHEVVLTGGLCDKAAKKMVL